MKIWGIFMNAILSLTTMSGAALANAESAQQAGFTFDPEAWFDIIATGVTKIGGIVVSLTGVVTEAVIANPLVALAVSFTLAPAAIGFIFTAIGRIKRALTGRKA